MPYGIPHNSIEGYQCLDCRYPRYGEYTPFCPSCGKKQPEENRAYLLGLGITSPTAGKNSTRDLDEIKAFITKHHGRKIRLWRYNVSHCELELRLRHSGDPGTNSEEPWLNTLIYCSADEISLPTLSWENYLRIESESYTYGERLVITDDRSPDIMIKCHILSLYFDLEGHF